MTPTIPLRIKKIGFIGLGRMGKEMVIHLLESGIDVAVFNRSREKTKELEKEAIEIPSQTRGKNPVMHTVGGGDPSTRPMNIGLARDDTNNHGKLIATYKLKELVNNLAFPRVIWLMVEHGKPVDEVIENLLKAGIGKGDIIIDGGNSFYKDSVRRYKKLKDIGIHYIDAGTSGGIEGARKGACLMIGGDKAIVRQLSWLWDILSGSPLQEVLLQRPSGQGGWGYFGPSGAGHFVKMVHNGVEYGMLQAIGEGFELLSKGPYKLDLHKIAVNWNHGSVVRGWLMELLEKAFKDDPKLERISGIVGGGSTGEWTVQTAKELGVESPVIRESLLARKNSRSKPTFAGKVVAALRYQFGGHPMEKFEDNKIKDAKLQR